MGYQISYVCISNAGYVRSRNEDNFLCNGSFLLPESTFPQTGTITTKSTPLFGVFDGLGGEAHGDVASATAARCAAAFQKSDDLPMALSRLCQDMNTQVYTYAQQHNIPSMGTTAAMMAFGKKEIALCNVGDSKIFRFHKGTLEQISEDHVAVAVYGRKPPLTQALGTPPQQGAITPYLAKGRYRHGDLYLLCSDGLTDMVSFNDISRLLTGKNLVEIAKALTDAALAQGGRDNITLILCRVERAYVRLFRCTP